jgi:single-stranded DNA-specific DHH superfamily exonuclease
MLTLKQLKELREHLDKSQNPLFLFDNDVDGLCSAAILQRASGKGKSVAIKTFPGLDQSYLRRIDELNPDYVFILDKAEIDLDFLKGVHERSLPVICIDHHPVKLDKEKTELAKFYNSAETGEEPTTYLAHMIYEREEDEWLAMIGCIGDVYKPDFAKSFAKNNPELFNNSYSAFDALFKTEIGRVASMLNFGLKDTTTNVLGIIRLLNKAKNVYDLLEENANTKTLHKRYKELNTICQKQVEKGNKNAGKKMVYLEYSGETSMSAEISNRLMFDHPEKDIIVVFNKNEAARISLRGKNAKKIVDNVVLKIPHSMGGGHEVACGAKIPSEEVENFKQSLKKFLKED